MKIRKIFYDILLSEKYFIYYSLMYYRKTHCNTPVECEQFFLGGIILENDDIILIQYLKY